MPSHSAIDVNCERLWLVAERARARGSLSREDIAFVRDTLPAALNSFPEIQLPKTIRHPGGFTVSGAPIGTFLRSALLIAGQKALGRRFANHSFFETVERDLALGVMRSHFHHEYPKGTHCCVRCTLAVYPVLEAGSDSVFRLRPAGRAGQADRAQASVAIRPTGECRDGALVARRRPVTNN